MSDHLEAAVALLVARIGETDAELRKLNKQKLDDREAINALHKAMGVGRSKPRTRGARNGAVPAPLQGLPASKRILAVMADHPDRQWSVPEMSAAIVVPNHETVLKALDRLKGSGEVRQTPEKNWVLATGSADPADA